MEVLALIAAMAAAAAFAVYKNRVQQPADDAYEKTPQVKASLKIPPIRYVTLTKYTGISPLSFAQIEVFDSQGRNVAASKPAAQSSGFQGVNGEVETRPGDTDVARRWVLDLLGDHNDISFLVVTNRRDMFQDYLTGAILSVLDNRGRLIAQKVLTGKPVEVFTREEINDFYWT